MKGKKYLVILLICLLVLSFYGCKTEEEKAAEQAKKNWEQTSDEAQMSIYCALIKEYMLLVEDFGYHTPYPSMNRIVKGYMMSSGLTKDEALESAKETILQEQAVFWYGEKAGVPTEESHVENYIRKNVLNEIQNNEQYGAVDDACRAEGITFEDTVWAYKDSYKMQYILLEAGIAVENQAEFVERLMEDYENSDEWEHVNTVLTACAALIRDGVTDKAVIREADIYFEQ